MKQKPRIDADKDDAASDIVEAARRDAARRIRSSMARPRPIATTMESKTPTEVRVWEWDQSQIRRRALLPQTPWRGYRRLGLRRR